MDSMRGELLAMRRIRVDASCLAPRDACRQNVPHSLMLTLPCRMLYQACVIRSKRQEKKRKEKTRKNRQERARNGKKWQEKTGKKRDETRRDETRETEHVGCDISRHCTVPGCQCSATHMDAPWSDIPYRRRMVRYRSQSDLLIQGRLVCWWQIFKGHYAEWIMLLWKSFVVRT